MKSTLPPSKIQNRYGKKNQADKSDKDKIESERQKAKHRDQVLEVEKQLAAITVQMMDDGDEEDMGQEQGLVLLRDALKKIRLATKFLRR